VKPFELSGIRSALIGSYISSPRIQASRCITFSRCEDEIVRPPERPEPSSSTSSALKGTAYTVPGLT
jgi:hypothetical protein